jgi:serine/threonine-protein phosphatase PGAM5
VNKRLSRRLIVTIGGVWFFDFGIALRTLLAKEAASVTFTATLYLVRHGAYDVTAKQGSEDGPGLTPLGVAQARLVAARLRGLTVVMSSLTVSTMTRAQETARVMHETLSGLPVRSTPSLRECIPPTSEADIVNEKRAAEARDCQKRLDEAFATYFVSAASSDQNDVLVCHGNVIRYFVLKALGVDARAWLGLSVAHASLTVIRVRADGSMTVLAVGDVGRLPPNMQSWRDSDPQLIVPKGAVAPWSSEYSR